MVDTSSQRCAECGAAVSSGSTCREHFHALLALEQRLISEGVLADGITAHFLAVSSYGVQHPEGFGYTQATMAAVVSSLAAVLAGAETVADVRRRTRRLADGPTRVLRRAGDPVPTWGALSWTRSILHALDGPDEGYGERVARWATSVVDDLRAAGRLGPG